LPGQKIDPVVAIVAMGGGLSEREKIFMYVSKSICSQGVVQGGVLQALGKVDRKEVTKKGRRSYLLG